MAGKRIRITQTKSEIRQPKRLRQTLRALGLKGYQRSAEQPDNPAIRGMISKVHHLVKVEEA
jgi:ribosomal protein L30